MAVNSQSTHSKFHKAKNKMYTFVSQGTPFAFDPTKKANLNGELSNLLELHKQEVKFRNSPDVFILTNAGEVLKVN